MDVREIPQTSLFFSVLEAMIYGPDLHDQNMRRKAMLENSLTSFVLHVPKYWKKYSQA